jgi:hypothetical protein
MLAGHGAVDFRFFVVVLELGEVHNPVLARVRGLLVDFEHDLVGFKCHGYFRNFGLGLRHPSFAGKAALQSPLNVIIKPLDCGQ